MKHLGLSLFVVSLSLAVSAQAVEYTNAVLDLGVGARALGMGGANVGLADDATATYWNPAGLTNVQNVDLMIAEEGSATSALNLGTNDVDSQYLFLSGAMTVPQIGSFGLSVLRFGDGGIPEVGTGTDGSGAPNQYGSFSDSDTGIFASYARSVAPWLSLGTTLKFLFGGTAGLTVQSDVPGVTGNSTYDYFGLDLGAQLKFGAITPDLEGLTLGLNVQDLLNSGVKWQNTPTDPTEMVGANPKTGFGYSLPFDFLKQAHTEVNLALDVDPSLYAPSLVVHYGAEVWYKQVLAFRGGVMQFTDSAQAAEPSLGMSLRLFHMLQMDFAYIYYELTPLEYIDLDMHW